MAQSGRDLTVVVARSRCALTTPEVVLRCPEGRDRPRVAAGRAEAVVAVLGKAADTAGRPAGVDGPAHGEAFLQTAHGHGQVRVVDREDVVRGVVAEERTADDAHVELCRRTEPGRLRAARVPQAARRITIEVDLLGQPLRSGAVAVSRLVACGSGDPGRAAHRPPAQVGRVERRAHGELPEVEAGVVRAHRQQVVEEGSRHGERCLRVLDGRQHGEDRRRGAVVLRVAVPAHAGARHGAPAGGQTSRLPGQHRPEGGHELHIAREPGPGPFADVLVGAASGKRLQRERDVRCVALPEEPVVGGTSTLVPGCGRNGAVVCATAVKCCKGLTQQHFSGPGGREA